MYVSFGVSLLPVTAKQCFTRNFKQYRSKLNLVFKIVLLGLLMSSLDAKQWKLLLYKHNSPVSFQHPRLLWWYHEAKSSLEPPWKTTLKLQRYSTMQRDLHPTLWAPAWLDWLIALLISLVALILEESNKCPCLRVLRRAVRGKTRSNCLQRGTFLKLCREVWSFTISAPVAISRYRAPAFIIFFFKHSVCVMNYSFVDP